MKQLLSITFGTLACLAAASAAHAAYPDKPVKIVVPQAPGGASDALARIMAQKLSTKWGQPVVVENRAGAGGNIGLDLVAKGPKDGYTLLLSYEGTQAINTSLYKRLSYDPVKDFVPLATIATVPFIAIVHNGVPAKTFAEFVKLGQSSPRTYGSAGSGTVNHLLGEMVNMVTKTKLTHVPYKGAAPAMTDLIGGRIDAVFTSVPSVASHVESGTVRALAVTSAARTDRFPKLPTIAESGYANFNVAPWFGLFAPAGVPAEVVTRVNDDVAAILKEDATKQAFAAQGATPMQTSPEQFKALLAADIQKWAAVVKESGASAD